MEASSKPIAVLAAEQCAPVIFHIKPSNLLILDRSVVRGLKPLIDRTGLKARCLYHRDRRQVWFMYREAELSGYLSDPQHRAFIEQFGYKPDMSLDAMLRQVAVRFTMYRLCGGTFPHEIGIFLGYPLCDVQGFMENNGKNSLYTGYWKVYKDVAGARRTFRRYDLARQAALRLVRADRLAVGNQAIVQGE